jgi:hypothetical protein
MYLKILSLCLPLTLKPEYKFPHFKLKAPANSLYYRNVIILAKDAKFASARYCTIKLGLSRLSLLYASGCMEPASNT